jgi:drug/metabolite transporter (DMT)-like permease
MAMEMMTRMRANWLLVACAAVWGVAFYFQKRAMEHIGPLLFIVARSVLAMAVLAPLAWREWRAERSGRPQTRLLKMSGLAGLAFFGGALFQQAGIVTASVTNSGFLTSLYVVITPFVAWAVHGRRPGFWVWPAVGLSMVGTWLLGGGTLALFTWGDWLVAISAVFWAVYVVVVGLGSSEGKPSAFTALQFVVVAVLGLVGVGLREEVDGAALWRALPDLLFVGVLSSALMFTLFAAAMKATRATETAIIVSTESLFAALAAWWWLDERLPPLGWLGAMLLVAATLVVQLPWWSKPGKGRGAQ